MRDERLHRGAATGDPLSFGHSKSHSTMTSSGHPTMIQLEIRIGSSHFDLCPLSINREGEGAALRSYNNTVASGRLILHC
jgi:hypothetical protein